MNQIATKYFGQITYTEDSAVEFPDGIPGFEDQHGFVIVQQPATKPLVFLQSLNKPELCFTTVPARAACPDYRLAIPSEDLVALGLPAGRQPDIGRDVLCLTIISVAEDASVTANLLAPLVINIQTGRGRQPIMVESDYSHRHSLDAPREAVQCS
ncbi:MAG: flagellar assembly protein FliW [Bryobacteraceae bacterium]